MKNVKKIEGSLLVKLAMAAALAVSAGYMYVTHKEEIDSEGKKKLDQLAKTFSQSKSEIEKRVKKVWGNVSNEAITTYLDVRGSILHMLEAEKKKQQGVMLKKRYEEIVDSVMKEAKKTASLGKEIQENLTALLKKDWNEIEKAMVVNMKQLQKTVRKSLESNKKEMKKPVKEVKSSMNKLMDSKKVQQTLAKGKKIVNSAVKKGNKKVESLKKEVKRVVQKKR